MSRRSRDSRAGPKPRARRPCAPPRRARAPQRSAPRPPAAPSRGPRTERAGVVDLRARQERRRAERGIAASALSKWLPGLDLRPIGAASLPSNLATDPRHTAASPITTLLVRVRHRSSYSIAARSPSPTSAHTSPSSSHRDLQSRPSEHPRNRSREPRRTRTCASMTGPPRTAASPAPRATPAGRDFTPPAPADHLQLAHPPLLAADPEQLNRVVLGRGHRLPGAPAASASAAAPRPLERPSSSARIARQTIAFHRTAAGGAARRRP